jgi:lipopolysaccharide transport system permease protein
MKISNILSNLKLSIEFAKREIKERYIGTSFGQFWLIISPLISIFIYTIIFSDFMKMRMNVIENKYAYSIYLIPGLISWTFFTNVVGRLTNSVFEKASIIKKINVPMYVYYVSILLTEFTIYLISIIFGLIFLVLIHYHITIEYLWLIPLMFLISIFALGVGVIFSLLNPFFKDLKEFVPVILQLWFWITPIIYVKSMIEHKYPFLIKYNPIYYFIEPMQDIFLYGKILNYKEVVIAALIAFITLIIAGFLYKKLINEIKDII